MQRDDWFSAARCRKLAEPRALGRYAGQARGGAPGRAQIATCQAPVLFDAHRRRCRNTSYATRPVRQKTWSLRRQVPPFTPTNGSGTRQHRRLAGRNLARAQARTARLSA